MVLHVVDRERELGREVLEHGRDGAVDLSLVGLGGALDRLGLESLHAQATSDRLGHVRAADVDLTAEAALTAVQDVDRGARGADVHERAGAHALLIEDLVVRDAAELPGVREGEQVEVDGDRQQTDLLDRVQALLDELTTAGGEQDRHAVLAGGVPAPLLTAARGAAPEGLAVHDHLVDLEGQVLVDLELDGLRQLGVRHAHHRHVAHDRRLAADTRTHPLAAKPVLGEDLGDSLGHAPARRDLGAAEACDDGLRPLEGDLHGLDHGGTEV